MAQALQGDIFLAQKKIPQAIEAYQKAYRINPNDDVLEVLTSLMQMQDPPHAAIQFLNDALKQKPLNHAARLKLASIYQQQQNLKDAEAHYKTLLETQPDNALALNNLAWLYFQQHKPDALKLAERAYSKAPDTAIILDTYGLILVKQGELTQGIAILEKALQLSPTNGDIHYHLAEAHASHGNKDQAIKMLQAVLKDHPHFSERKAAGDLLKHLQAE